MSELKSIRVLLVDDHALVRAGIRSLLGKIAGIEVAGEAASGHEALTAVEALHPDVVLMDVVMPGLNGLETTARLKQCHPNVRVLVVSMNAYEENITRALRAGAAGYLLKNAGTAELEAAVKAVAAGETYLCPRVSRIVVDEYLRNAVAPTSRLERLSVRQREVLQLIAEGNTSKQVARQLQIGVSTVETHRSQIMDALDLHDLASLVRFAVRVGLVPADG